MQGQVLLRKDFDVGSDTFGDPFNQKILQIHLESPISGLFEKTAKLGKSSGTAYNLEGRLIL